MRRGRWFRRLASEPSIAGTVAVESVPYETPRRFSISRNLVARQPGVPVSSEYLAPVAPPDVRASGITLPVAPPDEFRVSGDSLRPVPPPVVPSRADVPFAPSGGAGASEDHLDAVAVPAVTAGADLPYAPPDAFGVSPDHFPPVVAPEVDASGLALPFTPPDAFAISANHLPPIAPRIDGVFFHRDRKMGQASRPRTERSGVRRPRIAPPSPFLALLPILLPPAPDTTDSPFAFPHPLYEFQGKGVEWLLEHDAALLADDMGLGKTVQAIAALRHKFRNGAMRALVVCPKSVQSSWARHFREWAPELEAITIAGAPYERRHQWRALHNYRAHVGMITYASLRIDVALAQEAAYDALVLDEIQNVKNPVTQQSRAVRSLESTARWGLSGTPLENDVEDLATILRTLGPGLLPAKGASTNEVRAQARRVMIRRRKEDVLEDLPPIRSAIEYLDLTDRQRRAYEQAEEEGVARLRDGTTVTIPGILALITRLKQICNGVDGHSAKLDWLKDYLGIVVDEGDKALVFSQYVDTLRAIEPEIRHFSPLSYTGSLTDRARDKVVSAFQEDDARHHALLMSLKAGGTGLTLTAASRVVHFDSWWNPAVMEQAAARVHRIGQKKAVFVTTLVTEDTIEERIQKILDGKRELFKAMVDDLSTEGVARALTEEELYGLFDMKPPSQRQKADRNTPAYLAASDHTQRQPDAIQPREGFMERSRPSPSVKTAATRTLQLQVSGEITNEPAWMRRVAMAVKDARGDDPWDPHARYDITLSFRLASTTYTVQSSDVAWRQRLVDKHVNAVLNALATGLFSRLEEHPAMLNYSGSLLGTPRVRLLNDAARPEDEWVAIRVFKRALDSEAP